MALPANGFSLTDVNTELGTSGQSLVSCISLAGKTGTWDSLLDFAGYSHLGNISVSPPSVTVSWAQPATSCTITSSGIWQVVTPYPSWITNVNPSTGGSGLSATISLLANETGSSRVATLTFRLTSQPTVTDTIVITQTPM